MENSFARHLATGRIIEDDVILLREWLNERIAQKHLSVARVNKLAFQMVTWRRFIGPFRTNTIADINAGITQLMTASSGSRLFDRDLPAAPGQDGRDRATGREPGEPYSRNTIHDLIGLLKRFYSWMIEEKGSKIEPKKIREIKVPAKDRMTTTVEMIVTPEEAEAVLRACENPRDRALFSMLWDGAFRIGELGTLTWGQVRFDGEGAVVNVDAKTEFPRHVPLYLSSAYLAQWRDSYPCEISSDALVFLTRQHRPMTYDAIAVQLKKLLKKAGISKKITFHKFRHGRVTDLLRRDMSGPVLHRLGWGNPGTKMLATYGHLADDDIDDAMRAAAGIRSRRKGVSAAMNARECPRCGVANPPTVEFCYRCATPLTEEFASNLEELRREIEKTDEYRTALEAAMMNLADLRTRPYKSRTGLPPVSCHRPPFCRGRS